ncbi:MAG: hypothetical protein FRX49_12667 [Trebouxia sp. A1-2]|nr:MAG: hypothetical protein FRX49_12667 [Trebouxia sp. A1-2]
MAALPPGIPAQAPPWLLLCFWPEVCWQRPVCMRHREEADESWESVVAIQSCQRKEGPLAGVQPVKVAKAFLPQTPLLSVVRGQKLSLGSGLLDPGHNQLIHQLKQAQIQTALLALAGAKQQVADHGHKGAHLQGFGGIIYHLKEAFKGCNMQEQFAVGDFRIDLYFVDQKIAVECDENGHRGRDLGAEIARQQFITKQLDCKWVRFNPDAKDFSIFAVINNIMRLLL